MLKGKPGTAGILPWDYVHKGRPVIGTVFSPSGGVGKSSLAMNLAAYIARNAVEEAEAVRRREGLDKVAVPRVLVLDGDLCHGSLAIRLLWDERNPTTSFEPSLTSLVGYMERRQSMGFVAPETWPRKFLKPPVPEEQPMHEFILYNEALPNLNLLGAPEHPDKFFDFRPNQFREILTMLASYYSVIIIDSGTEIVMESQRAWLSHAHHLFLLMAPDIDRVINASKYVPILTEPRKHPRDTSDKPVILPPLVPIERVTPVMTRYDLPTKLDPDKVLKKFFPQFDRDQIVRMPDFQREMSAANNSNRFLVDENTEFREVVADIAGRLFGSYVEQLPDDSDGKRADAHLMR